MRGIAVVLLLSLVACASDKPVERKGDAQTDPSAYDNLINRNTAHVNRYSGFYQTFQADVTILTNEVATAVLKQRAHFLQWDDQQYQAERTKMTDLHAVSAPFFLRFFSAERDYDDLGKPKSIWKVYLEISGQRLEGKIKKADGKFVELATLYNFMDRFSTAYEVTFAVPMSTVEHSNCKLILTSSLGEAEFVFPRPK